MQAYVRSANFIPAKTGHVKKEFKGLILWHRSNKKRYHPVAVAAYVHHVFETIHPFRDGNGRTGRLMVNFILRKNGFPMANIRYKERRKYYQALQKANASELKPLVDLIADYAIKSEPLF